MQNLTEGSKRLEENPRPQSRETRSEINPASEIFFLGGDRDGCKLCMQTVTWRMEEKTELVCRDLPAQCPWLSERPIRTERGRQTCSRFRWTDSDYLYKVNEEHSMVAQVSDLGNCAA